MKVVQRSYQREKDYDRVGQFLIDTYQPGVLHYNWLRPRWEYMHYHPWLDKASLGKIGVWESGGEIAAVAHYEGALGDAFFQVHPDYTYLKPEMLDYAEANLVGKTEGGKPRLTLWAPEFDAEFESVIKSHGYKIVKEYKDCWSVLPVPRPFPPIKLPPGFRLQSLEDENDLVKLTRLIHRGFNHPGEPPASSAAGTELMQNAPNYRKGLNIVAVDEKGNYAAYGGIWPIPEHKLAYIEPVCTDPAYRRRGLGKAAVMEGIRRCGLEGIDTIMVGSEQPFYLAMGFKKQFHINLWNKIFQ
jgi:predicted N-acetyltransferase YhbS